MGASRASSVPWILVRAAQGAAAGMLIGAVLGAWASRVNGDAGASMLWLALGRLLAGVAGVGLAGLLSSVLLAAAVAGAARLGRGAAAAAGVAILGLGAWGAWASLGPWRETVFRRGR